MHEPAAESARIGNAEFGRLAATALPSDWALIGRCRTGTGTSGDHGGCFVLAHGTVGVALVDLAPCTTPDAELRLRRLLNLVDFSADYRGYLPIVYCRTSAEAMGGLSHHLDAAFAYEPRLSIRRRTTWVTALRRVLRASATWEAIGRPLPVFAGQHEDAVSSRRQRVLLPRGTLAVAALLATFGVGIASGLLWVPSAAPARQSVEAAGELGDVAMASTAAPVTAAAVTGGLGRTGPAGTGPAVGTPDVAAASARDADSLVGAATRAVPDFAPAGPAFDLPARPAAIAVPPLLSASVRSSGLSVVAEADPGAGLTGALPQPAASEAAAGIGTPPPRRVRDPQPIDRRCSDAVFRYQQGGSLSEGEMGYVRRGCASWR